MSVRVFVLRKDVIVLAVILCSPVVTHHVSSTAGQASMVGGQRVQQTRE